MRINHNISSLITQGSLKQVNRSLNKSLQKLSTGLRINSAADDAAGLGVSENLRTQVKGMSQAIRNTQDTIALLNIADGALNEQADIMQRMRELVLQAMNDTYTDTERSYVHQEFTELKSELDRINASTTYNGMRIFASPLTDAAGEGIYGDGGHYEDGDPNKSTYGRLVFDTPDEWVFGANDYSSSHHFNMMIGANYSAQDAAAYNDGPASSGDPGSFSYDSNAHNMVTIAFGDMSSNALFSTNPFQNDIPALFFDDFDDNFMEPPPDGLGDVAYHVGFMAAHGRAPGITDKLNTILKLIDGDVESIDTNIRQNLFMADDTRMGPTGIDRINKMRSYIGAMTNRLEHNVNNLMNTRQNTQAAESLVRDAEFASETARFTKNQILSQSATSMLSQANIKQQGVLQLLG
ncbi:MAG: flagellin [Fibrobacterota bacterium]